MTDIAVTGISTYLPFSQTLLPSSCSISCPPSLQDVQHLSLSREDFMLPQPERRSTGSTKCGVAAFCRSHSAASRPFLSISKPILSHDSSHQLMPRLSSSQFCLLTSHHSTYLMRTGNWVKLFLPNSLPIVSSLNFLNMDDLYNDEI